MPITRLPNFFAIRLPVHNIEYYTTLMVRVVCLVVKNEFYILKAIFTFFMSLQTLIQAYSVAVVVTYFEQFIVLQALLLTVVVVAGLTVYTLQAKRDFSSLGSL